MSQRRISAAQARDLAQKVEAMERSQAVIEFELDGTIIRANDNFLAAVGYTLDEVVGQHHRIFVDDAYASSEAYQRFWEKLRSGSFHAGEYERVGKDGERIWIQASYNPCLDAKGQPVKVVKFAQDITAQKRAAADAQGQLDAIGRAQAVIEFDLDGTIRHANDNFLGAVGYELEEIVGKHHRMFVAEDYAASDEYASFWRRLRGGEFFSREYKRFGKGGKEIYISASYNPILDASGRPFKVVKFAVDVTERVKAVERIQDALGKLATGDADIFIDETYGAAYLEQIDRKSVV
jgi:methyl-accepting chemotaxis protein